MPESTILPTPLNAKTALIERLKNAGGKISLRDYMAFCLSDPDYGYYSTKKPLGKEGDFITAPEISQIFGELIGLWFVNFWEGKGSPPNIALFELGPGRGLLMRDILRAFKIRPALLETLKVHQVEINPHLKKEQKAAIAPVQIQHHENVTEALKALEGKTTLLVANEFFDAFPIDQYVYKDQAWQKRSITYDSNKDAFQFQEDPFEDTCGNCTFPMKPNEGTVMESAPLVENFFREICQHITQNGGAGLIIDYGYDQFCYGDTFQALEHHKKVRHLENPGGRDLTVHVNFATLLRIAQQHKGFKSTLETHVDFLQNLGIDIRTNSLAKNAQDFQIKEDLMNATNRLVAKDQMGELFKALQIWS